LSGLHEQAVADVPIRFEGLPGEYLQVDWGEIRHFPFTQQKPVTRYFLACRLKYSRWTWVLFTNEMRQETLFRGLVACFNALAFVPWVLVFDNMKTVTTGRDAQAQPIWHPALLQLAAEFDFHPEACWPASGNQKGSVESLVKFVKKNFLAGRAFVDDTDLQAQCVDWQERTNTTRPSQATDVTPGARLVEEVAKGYPLPATAADYGFAQPGQVRVVRWWPCSATAIRCPSSTSARRSPCASTASASSSGATRNCWLNMPVRQTEHTAASWTQPTSRRCSDASRVARSCCTARHSWAWVLSLSSM
jgi:hypothetical protein